MAQIHLGTVCFYVTLNSNPVPGTWIEVTVPKPDLARHKSSCPHRPRRLLLLVPWRIAWPVMKPNGDSVSRAGWWMRLCRRERD